MHIFLPLHGLNGRQAVEQLRLDGILVLRDSLQVPLRIQLGRRFHTSTGGANRLADLRLDVDLQGRAGGQSR